ncbi:hypothetical protein [Umezawaea sp.]|uniref:hypothetical protein n=1 Tax=Umezawaea sp. TaxID=1955258 RepID=UPI002ED65A47
MTGPRHVEAGAPPLRRRFSRIQLLALVAGLWQVAAGAAHLLPLPTEVQALQVCTGLVGVALCGRHHHARLYGVALALVYGRLLLDFASPLVFDLPTPEGLAYARTAVSGLLIALVPAGRSAPRR